MPILKHFFYGVIPLTLALSSQVFAGETPEVSQAQLMSLLTAPSTPAFIVLDVRTKEEFDQGHIKGAINISHKQLADNITQLQRYQHEKVIVHCRSGKRAAIAESVLEHNGFTRVQHLNGDIIGWQEAKLPLVGTEQQ